MNQPFQPPQGYAMQQYAPQQSQPGFGPPQMPGPQYPVQHQPQGPLPQVSALPTLNTVDESLVQQAYANNAAEVARLAKARAGGGGGKWKRFKPKGPNGETDFKKVAPGGASKQYTLAILPSSQPGALPFEPNLSHFIPKSNRSVSCAGKTCPICSARNSLFTTGRADDAERAKKIGPAKHGTTYQLIDLDDPYFHVDGDKMVPMTWDLSPTAQTQLMDIFKGVTGGLSSVIVHLENGIPVFRPIAVTRKKTGPRDMDVEWAIVPRDMAALPQTFWPVLYNLIDLRKANTPLTREAAMQALQDLQLPFTPEASHLLSQLPSSEGQGQLMPPQNLLPAPQQAQQWAQPTAQQAFTQQPHQGYPQQQPAFQGHPQASYGQQPQDPQFAALQQQMTQPPRQG